MGLGVLGWTWFVLLWLGGIGERFDVRADLGGGVWDLFRVNHIFRPGLLIVAGQVAPSLCERRFVSAPARPVFKRPLLAGFG